MSKMLGWGFRIRQDSVEGRIRVDSGGFRAAPLCNLYGHFDPIKMASAKSDLTELSQNC